jgi:hypothetical protein
MSDEKKSTSGLGEPDRPLTAEEQDFLDGEISQWRDFAQHFIDTWPQCDQAWLAQIAPEVFGGYAADPHGA